MKTLKNLLNPALILAVVMCCFFSSFGQKTMNEQRAMKENHIDFSKEYIFFTIYGIVEIDGHEFKNDTCKSPIQFQANLDEIAIVDTLNKIEYSHRKCGKLNCNIIHLTKKEPELRLNNPIFPNWRYFNNGSNLLNRTPNYYAVPD